VTEATSYATVDDLELRLGRTLEGLERERAGALLHDASTVIRAVARGDWDDPAPDVVQTICLNMAIRAWHNPEGVRQQTLGDLSMTFGSVETGVTMTDEERRLIRIAAGFGVALDTIQLTTGDEAAETVFVPDTGGGDWIPWLTR
jgi:hypothetical protein